VPTLTVPRASSTGAYSASWTSVSNATHYELSEQVGGGSWAVIQDTSALSKAISGKANGSYGYRLRACNGSGASYCSAYTATSTISVSIPATPAVPTLTVPATSSTGSYTASWTTVSNATHYELSELVGSTWTVIQDTSATSKALSGKGNGSYGYRVRACNGSGTGNCSAYTATSTITVSIPVTIPGVPTMGGSKTLIDPDTKPVQYDVYLYWSAQAGATYYDLKKNTYIEYTGPDTEYTTIGVGVLSYQVRACNSAGCSAYSAAFSP
jgi:predicted phage tail protein